jgi:hypothetical protein
VRIGNDSVTAAKKAEGAQEVSEHCALRITGQSWLSRDMKGRFFDRDQLNGGPFPMTAWTSGTWDFGEGNQRPWNGLPFVPRDYLEPVSPELSEKRSKRDGNSAVTKQAP